MLNSYSSGSKRFEISNLQRCIQLSVEIDCTYFSTSSDVVRKKESDLATFLRLRSSVKDLKF